MIYYNQLYGCKSFIFIFMYLRTELFQGFSSWLCLLGVGMVECADGCRYCRYVWTCACYYRGILSYFSKDVLFLSGFFLPVISSISYLCDVRCFAVFTSLLKEFFPTGTIKLYCLYCIRSGQNHLATHSERGKKTSQTKKKRWEDNIKDWTGLEFAKSQRAMENRGEKNGGNWLWNHLWWPNYPCGYGIGQGEQDGYMSLGNSRNKPVTDTTKSGGSLFMCMRVHSCPLVSTRQLVFLSLRRKIRYITHRIPFLSRLTTASETLREWGWWSVA